jgi:acetyl esterase/lipase
MALTPFHIPLAFMLSLALAATGIAAPRTGGIASNSATASSIGASSVTASSATAAPTMSGTASHAVLARTGIAFTPSIGCGRSGERCVLRYDLYRPVGRGPWPMVVVAPGGPTSPTGGGHLTSFASRLAAAGAVVMVASWRQGDAYGGTVPRAFGDIGCAVRTARSIAAGVAADSGRIVLLGHSLGGWAGAVVALDPAASIPRGGECLARAGSTRPAAFVGIAGAYAGPAGEQDDVDWTDLIGATELADPGRWAQADPLRIASRTRAHRIPTLLIHGSADTGVSPTQTTRFAAALRLAGWRPQVLVERGFGHMSVLTAPATFTLIARTVNALPR